MSRHLERAAFILTALLMWSLPAGAIDIPGKELSLAATERKVKVIQFKAPGGRPRPAALLIHGSGGLDRRIGEFNHYASALAGAGIDAYLVYYYSDNDALYGGGDLETRYEAWVHLVDDIANDVLKMPELNGKIGLVGFSNGGIIAPGAAALEPKINAAVIYYGTEPWPLHQTVRHYPPLLILHGDNDQVIPIAAGKRLAANAKALGAPVELVIYPGEVHGFGTKTDTKNGADGLARTITFLTEQLITK